jgi:hypothetical protein
MSTILTDPSDIDAVRTLIGLDEGDLETGDILNTYLEGAETYISGKLAGWGVTLTVSNILAGSGGATAADKTNLIEAVRNYVAYKATPALPIMLNTSESVGPETVDQGTTQGWQDQAERFLMECDKHLAEITGFKRWRTL